MLRDLFDKATKLHAEIISLVPSVTQNERELEEVFIPPPLTAEEQCCEDYFAGTTIRDSSGRFIVRLPFKLNFNSCQLGSSKYIAKALLCSQRRKLEVKEPFYKLYM